MNFKPSFKLYQAASGDKHGGTTLFDLFSGKGETKQTKSLAYALKANPDFLCEFVKRFFPEAFGSLRKSTYVAVIAELIFSDSRRADIVLEFWDKKHRLAVIVIEAKGVGVKAKGIAVVDQLDGYLEKFKGISRKDLYGAILTKHKVYAEKYSSITWDDVVTLVSSQLVGKEKNYFLEELLDYLTEVGNGMKYYEKEVLSIPAGATIDEVEKHGVYVCPVARKHTKALFVTFRASGGGKMKKLYKVDHEVIVDPTEHADMERLKVAFPEIHEKISRYSEQNTAVKTEHMFFILSDKTIPLDHEPCPKVNNSCKIYYSLQAILDKNEKHPRPASQETD